MDKAPCQYNSDLMGFYDSNVDPERMKRDFIYAMMIGPDRAWYLEHITSIACLVLETLRIDPEDDTSIISICMRKVIGADLASHPKAKRFQPQPTNRKDKKPVRSMTIVEEESALSWTNVCSAIISYIDGNGEWETGQGVAKWVRIRDSMDTILFASLVLIPSFLQWFIDADERPYGDPQRNPHSPNIVNKERFLSFARNILPLHLEKLMNGSLNGCAYVDTFANSCRGDYIFNTGVYDPHEESGGYDPEPVLQIPRI
jgi:hypothetical protein